MKKYVCTVCGYIAEGEIPAQCPVCKAPASAFVEKTGNTYVTEHIVGIGNRLKLIDFLATLGFSAITSCNFLSPFCTCRCN